MHLFVLPNLPHSETQLTHSSEISLDTLALAAFEFPDQHSSSAQKAGSPLHYSFFSTPIISALPLLHRRSFLCAHPCKC
jgi:hypothetical protein